MTISPPTFEYARTSHARPAPILKGLDAQVHSWFGWTRRHSNSLAELRADAEQIDRLSKKYESLMDGALAAELLEHRATFRRGGRATEAHLFPALAAIREAAHRTMGMRPFLVQLMGALGLHRGMLVEMATGEGKTLTAGLAAVLAGWTHRPCHIITVNDYLLKI
jgi:preprotein translocase subunit SecA